jgi:hypothetical protein
LTRLTSSVGSIIKETKMDICSHRDTSRFVCFFLGVKIARAGIERGFNHCHMALRESGSLLVHDNTQEGIVDLKSAIVMNEVQFPEGS